MKYIVVGALACLPLQWFVVTNAGGGDLRIHQLAALALTAAIFLRYGLPKVGRGSRGVQAFTMLNVAMLLLWIVMNFYNGIGFSQPIKQISFLLTFVALAALLFIAVTENDFEMIDALRWTSVATVVVVVGAFGYSLLSNGVNPIDIVQRTISTGDPNILQKELFRSAFAGFGFDSEEARGNLRHEVFGGLLAAMYIAAWAVARRPFTIRRQRTIYQLSLAVGALLLLVSLSRSILVAAMIWPALSLVRALLTGRVSTRQQMAVLGGVFGLAALAISGFLSVVFTRFTDETSSYDTREELFSLALQRIQDNFWTGGIATERTSSHNFLLDMWQRGGIFVGIPAALIFLYISLFWARLLLQLVRSSDEFFILTAAMALPCVRLVTQGGGSLQIVEWVVLAFAISVFAAYKAQAGTDAAAARIALADEPEPAPEVAADAHLNGHGNGNGFGDGNGNGRALPAEILAARRAAAARSRAPFTTPEPYSRPLTHHSK